MVAHLSLRARGAGATRIRRRTSLAAAIALVAGMTAALTLSAPADAASSWQVSTTGAWSNAVGGGSTVTYCGAPTQQSCPKTNGVTYPGTEIRWGTPNGGTDKSGLGYYGSTSVPVSQGQQVALGRFDVWNFPINSGTNVTQVKLTVAVSLTDGTTTLSGNLPITVNYDETPNQTPCAYPSPQNDPCSDKVSYSFDPFQASSGGQLYTVSVTGFSTSPTDSSAQAPYAIVNEKTQTALYLFASFTIGHPPVANAGPDQNVEQVGTGTTNVTLDGTGSSDPDNDPLTYSWSWPTGTGTGTATGAQPTIALPPGATTVTLTVSDGQFSATDTTQVTVADTLPPTISGTAQPPANDNGWNNTPVTVTWTCADSGSGLAATGGCSAPATLSGDGAGQTATGTAKDNAGHTTTASVSNINIDTAAPTITGAAVEAPNANDWYRGDVHIAWTCADTGGSGLASPCPDPSRITGEGSGLTTSVGIADRAGNPAAGTSPAVRIDRQAPTTTITNVPDGWSASRVTVALTADDNLSGVDAIHYTLDGGDPQSVDQGGQVTIAGDGVHIIRYWATDKAGNTESAQQATVKVDGTAPTITHSLDPVPTGIWNTGDTTVTFTCADPVLPDGSPASGIASCTDPSTVTGEGRHQVNGTATDNAGNSANDTAGVNIDSTGPAVSTSRSGDPNGNGWYNEPVTVTFSCADPDLADGSPGSGVAACPAPVTVKTDGADQHVSGTGTDLAGNATTAVEGGINLDQAPPTVTGAIVDTPSETGWYAGDVTVHWTCSDAGSGLAGMCPADSVVDGTGAGLSVSVTVADLAGNHTTATVGGINIDRTPPTITGQATTEPNDAGWYNTPVTVHWSCSDGLSGVASCPDDSKLTSDGHELSVTGRAVDRAGNSAEATVSGINIDTVPPTLTGTPEGAPNTAGWYNHDVTIDWAAHDDGSGVDPLVVPAPTVISTEGSGQTASETVVDRASNSSGATESAPVNIDKTPPSTTAKAPTGWKNGTVTVQLLASDNLSGVTATHYTLDGGAEQDGSSVTIDTEGHHSLRYYSVDAAGNAETPRTVDVLIDKTVPTISHTQDPTANGAGWNNTPVKVTFSCDDPPLSDGSAGSGIASCGPDVTLTDEGAAETATGTALDIAGNSATDTATVKIDKTPPSIAGQVNEPPNANGWYNGPVAVGFTCSDALSGVASCPSDQQLADDGRNQSATGTATDVAGNTADTAVDGINIDTTAPTIHGATVGTPNSNGWFSAPVTVHFTASDALSGLDPAYPVTDTVVGEGANQSVSETVQDLAGNPAIATVSGINVDTTAPEISYTLSIAAPNSDGWYDAPVTVHFDCNDALSDVAQCTKDVTLGDGFDQSVTGTAVDNAGNTATITVNHLNVDTVAPAITFTGNAGRYTVDQTVDISCTASDTLSGVATSTCPSVHAPAYTLPVGPTTLTASATDHAGNVAHATTTFTVGVTCSSLEALTTAFSSNPDVAAGLNAKLTAACSATTAGGKSGPLNAYANQVRAQTGKALTADQATILARLVAAL